ncbi:hypothetical protein BBW65_06985 [Helicobacter enhydrae]|uniref:Phage tail tape measure protein n=1 Tax=Helicobacter enhydrae TaxID=222136 RepID=A0A1B1U6Y3_9HELI|nr:hypothetical protein [Helicobacter enhydrae]ANV98553.1 hypothetical protein BBW65_06985 [Helicobacter enhydrae]
MQENFGVNVTFNVKDGTITTANSKVVNLNKQVSLTQKSVSSLNASFQNTFFALGGLNLAFGALSASFGATFKSSLNLVSVNEQLQNSLASLISLNHSNIDTMGKSIDANEKWSASLELSGETIKKLNVINLKTIYTMRDMSEMFKSFYSTAGSSMSLEEAINAMEAIAYAGQVSGASVDSLKMTLDSLGAGVAQTNTDFGRFVNSLGLSTEAMSKAKAEGRLYSLIMEKLGSFANDASRSANTYEASVSNLTNAMEELKRKAMEPYFEGIKDAINATSGAISKNQEVVLESLGVLSRLAGSVAILWGATKGLNLVLGEGAPLRAYASELKRIEGAAHKARFAVGGLFSILKRFAPTAGIFAVMEVWSKWNETINETQEKLSKLNKDGLENKLLEAKERLERAGENLEKARKEGGILNKFREQEWLGEYSKAFKEVQDLEHRIKIFPQKKVLEQKNKANTPNLKAIKDASLAYREMAKVGLGEYNLALIEIAERTQKWVDEGVRLNEALAVQNILLQDLESNQATKEINADLEDRAAFVALSNDGIAKSIELEKIRYEKAIANLNERVAKEVELQEMSWNKANELYKLEEQKHQRALEQIKEEHRLKSGFGGYFSEALSENFINILNGKGVLEFGKKLEVSASQAFGRSLAKSFEDSRVGKAMDKAFDLAITKASGALGSCLDGLFGEKFASNLSDALGGALAGIGVGIGVGNLFASFMDKDHQKAASRGGEIGATSGAGIGAALGTWVIPGLGTGVGAIVGGVLGGLLGSVVGSVFNTKTEKIADGVEVRERGNKDKINAREYQTFKTTNSYWWGLKKTESVRDHYTKANSYALMQVRHTLRGFENLIADIGGSVDELAISAGKYADYQSMSDSVVEQVIGSVMGKEDKELIAGVYQMWSDYAKSINKSVSQAVMEGMASFVKSGQSYTKWLYDFRGDALGSAKYSAELAQKEVDRLQEALGVSGINVDNFLDFREEMIKNAFDPSTINLINSLGEALKNSAEASKKFEEALKKENKTKLKALDPFLKKTKTLEEANQTRGEIGTKTNLKILSVLQKILKAQEVVSYGGAV